MQVSTKANGFSLVEVVVAMVVLTVGMLAMAASTGYVSTEIRNSSFNTQRAFARSQAIEQLRSIPFDSVGPRSTPLAFGRYNMTWTSTNTNSNLKTVQVIASGPGYIRARQGTRQTVVDTAVVNIVRP
jgi:prepilin-type N-terminal cleavage/methylation domain-containing protein